MANIMYDVYLGDQKVAENVTDKQYKFTSLTANKDYTYGVIAKNGDKESDKATATFKTSPVSVTGVTLNKTSTSIAVGANETLTATVAPSTATNKTVTWSTSDATIATVSNGKVAGVKAGTATITVKTADGNKTATCAVTITEVTP